MNTANMLYSTVCILFFACLTSAYPGSRGDGGVFKVDDTPTAELDSDAQEEFFSLRNDESLSWNEMKQKLRQWAENVNKAEELENYLVKAEKRKEDGAKGLKNIVDMLEEKVSALLEIIRDDEISMAEMREEFKKIIEESPVTLGFLRTMLQFPETKRNTRSADVELQDVDKEGSASQARSRVRRGCRKPNGDFCRWPMNCDWFCNH